jgi:HlyD family secretion protein
MKLTWQKGAMVAAAAVVIGTVVYFTGDRGVPVEAGRVMRGPLAVYVGGEGKVRVRTRHIIGAPVSGHLERISIKAGKILKEGDTLANIAAAIPSPLDARSVAEARARLSAAEAIEAEAQAGVERAVLARELAAKDLARFKKLAVSGAITPKMMDGAEFEAKATQKAMEAAQHAAASAKNSVSATRALLREYESGRPALQTVVRVPAPVSGTVLRVYAEQEGPVMAGTPLIELADPRDLEAATDLLTTDAARVKPGMPVSIVRWGGKNALSGKVTLVEPSAFTKLSALGVEEQRVFVIAVPDGAGGSWDALSDGYRVETRIEVWSHPDVKKIPVAALFRRTAGWYAFSVEGGRALEHKVEIGEKGENEAELISGLEDGAKVILYPSDKIKDGVKVDIKG